MIPHRCPICNGSGAVPVGLYSPLGTAGDLNAVPCRSCQASGIVWGPPPFALPLPQPPSPPTRTGTPSGPPVVGPGVTGGHPPTVPV